MFQKILVWLRRMLDKMINSGNVSSKMNVDISISSDMSAALQMWRNMYINEASWLTTDIYSMGLPAAIASEIARAVTIEMEVEISGGKRANFLNEQFKKVMNNIRNKVELGCAIGGLVIKPYPLNDGLAFDFVPQDSFFPIDYDDEGNIISVIFIDQQTIKGSTYTRLEYHFIDDEGYHIINRAFTSKSKDELGSEIPLDSLDAWADLEEHRVVENVDKPLYAYFRYPLSNNVDTDSPLGISCYSKAQQGKLRLIQEADTLYSQFIWELDSAQRALYVDVLAFDKDSDDLPKLPDKRLYRTLNKSGNIDDENLFDEWSPNIRQEEYLKSLNAVLKRIEFNCGLAYGTLSDPMQVDKTATEIKSAKQRSYSTITDTQKSLQRCLDQLIYVMDLYTTMYKLSGKGSYEVAYTFDDSIITDYDTQRQHDLEELDRKIMSRVEYRIANYGETEQQAEEAIAKIDAESKAKMNAFEFAEMEEE